MKKNSISSPRTQETAATRSRSTSSRLAFGNATPEHVPARHHRCSNASTVADRESPASGAVGYASSSDVDSRFDPKKGCRVCRINEPAPPGHSCRLKQKKEKSAGRRCRIQSESLLLDRRHRRVRPHHHAQTILLRFLASNKSKLPRLCRFPGARKQEAEAASQRRE